MSDLAAWTPIAVAIIGVLGVLAGQRYGRLARLERENRQLWFVNQRLLRVLIANDIALDDELVELINGKDTS